MLYMILGQDRPNSLEARLAARPAHVARLKEMQSLGRLVLAGPLPIADAPDLSAGAAGSLVVLEFETLAEAETWARADPYIEAGVYEQVTVKPFLKVLPA